MPSITSPSPLPPVSAGMLLRELKAIKENPDPDAALRLAIVLMCTLLEQQGLKEASDDLLEIYLKAQS